MNRDARRKENSHEKEEVYHEMKMRFSVIRCFPCLTDRPALSVLQIDLYIKFICVDELYLI